IYDFPGGYARKYDDIDNSDGTVGAASDDKEKTAINMIQALDGRYRTATGMANFCGMTAGYKFKLKNHPNSDYNAEYIITEITHQAEQSPDYTSEDTIPEPYRNNFTCITYGKGAPPYRPLRRTPKPLVTGSQTAYVVGPAGEEIYTDKFGRVKVQFHWDREGKNDSDSSCWLRVAQSWAGNKWGTMFIPRIGMEVIVDFLEGNPDQPIITGCVYNPEMMPPYTLPDEKTKATIKSNSSKGGGGFNEFRFEDKKGSEQIFIHAEKNEDIRVKNDCMETIVHDRHLVVKNDQLEKVTYDKHLILGGDRNEKIGGSQSLNVGGSIQEKAGMKYAMDAGTEVHIKAGINAVIEAGMSLTIKASGGFINIGPTGVTISGTMVLINSGGAAGTGSGSNPEAPKEAKEADTADPGDRPMPPKLSPPLKPETYSQQAQAIQNSAEDGTAFTEI
ncbi:MAG TPA: type VI secretion system tip protein TssI/VgrG, partial [Pyrinomonadaceae bacterium]|nr:type VI secretion system tip protein TssI/VgrG [Pyrinomonadaceae bacterium]